MLKDKKVIYVDMDNVLVNFMSGVNKIPIDERKKYKIDEIPNVFSLMEPVDGAIETMKKLITKYDVYILTTAPWENPSAWTDKLNWIKKYLPFMKKRLIISHHKNLCMGDYLIDDRIKCGVRADYELDPNYDDMHRSEFSGIHIHFGTDPNFMTWDDISNYFMNM